MAAKDRTQGFRHKMSSLKASNYHATSKGAHRRTAIIIIIIIIIIIKVRANQLLITHILSANTSIQPDQQNPTTLPLNMIPSCE
jgi:hypothetical protein